MFASAFESEERSFRNKKNGTAIFVTVAIHALILLALIFSILHTPLPPFEDNGGGMSVNYGTDETGQGDIQPFTYNPGPTEAAAPAPASNAAVEESQPEEKLLTQEESDVTVEKHEDKPKQKVNKNAVFKKNKKPVVTESKSTAVTEAPPAPTQPKADPNALFSKGAYGKPNNSKGDGTGGPQGDQGKPDGDPNSRNYLGDGSGNGSGHGNGDLNGGFSLHGRKKLTLPAPSQCSNQGKVVIAIKVDKTGKVVDAEFKRFASTVFDDCNKNNALIAARKATFNPDPTAPDIQEGTITYVYKVH